MKKLIVINGSPRGLNSNSKKYIDIFKKSFTDKIMEYTIVTKKYNGFLDELQMCNDLLFVFPLYVDGIPSILIEFLKYLESNNINGKNVHVIVNCGFLEVHQNFVAIDIIKEFCRQNKLHFGTCLCIGSGEAILNTPFALIVRNKLKKVAKSIINEKDLFLTVTMPINKKMFLKASTIYWEKYGAKNGISKKEMENLNIE